MPDYAPANRFEGSSSSWMLKLGFVWGGELVSVLTSSILQMGFIWHITFVTNSASMLSLASLAGFLPLALFGIWAEYSGQSIRFVRSHHVVGVAVGTRRLLALRRCCGSSCMVCWSGRGDGCARRDHMGDSEHPACRSASR